MRCANSLKIESELESCLGFGLDPGVETLKSGVSDLGLWDMDDVRFRIRNSNPRFLECDLWVGSDSNLSDNGVLNCTGEWHV